MRNSLGRMREKVLLRRAAAVPYRTRNPITVAHSQRGLLWVSFTWGASYIIPEQHRIPFSEVFPAPLAHSGVPMWGWGVLLLASAVTALISERLVARTRNPQSRAWRAAWISHMVLAGIYGALVFGSLVQGLSEVDTTSHTWWADGMLCVVSALSRPVLWGYIAYQHSTYARMPGPVVGQDEYAASGDV